MRGLKKQAEQKIFLIWVADFDDWAECANFAS